MCVCEGTVLVEVYVCVCVCVRGLSLWKRRGSCPCGREGEAVLVEEKGKLSLWKGRGKLSLWKGRGKLSLWKGGGGGSCPCGRGRGGEMVLAEGVGVGVYASVNIHHLNDYTEGVCRRDATHIPPSSVWTGGGGGGGGVRDDLRGGYPMAPTTTWMEEWDVGSRFFQETTFLGSFNHYK